jgi:hypothetical protein
MKVRAVFLAGMAVALLGAAARAQYGYPVGRYGFGGWSSTVGGDMARGMGALAEGAGQYNVQTAAAASVNADTVMRVNQYMFSAQQEANQREFVRRNRRIDKTNTTLAQNADRLRNRPEPNDIDRGDALNVLLDDLTAPAVLHGSGLRLAGSDLDAVQVREIPFRNAAEAVTICLDQLTDKERFPALLRSDPLTSEREAFVAAVAEAKRQARENGELKPDAVRTVQETGKALYAKASSPTVSATPTERSEALNYLKGMAALAKIAENPDTLQAMRDLKQIKTTHVANLIAFMHTYNLRFGPAESPAQRTAYRYLYPSLKADRDRIYAALSPSPTQPPPPPDPKVNPVEVFHGLQEKHLNLPSQKP